MDSFTTDTCLFLLTLAVFTGLANFVLHYITTRRYADVSGRLEKLSKELDKKLDELGELNKIPKKKQKK